MLTRLRSVQAAMVVRGVDTLLLTTSPDLYYLLGVPTPFNQRLTVAIVRPEGEVRVGTSVLLAAHFGKTAANVETWSRDDCAVEQLVQMVMRESPRRVAVDDAFSATQVLALVSRMRAVEIIPALEVMSAARQSKDAHELALLQEAATRVERAWSDAGTVNLLGCSEYEIADRMRNAMIATGLDSVAWCDVAGGPNAPEPLHHGSDRRVERGDVIVMDLAGEYRGYHADICRTVCIGSPDPAVASAYAHVSDALDASLTAIRPGMYAGELDAVARGRLSGIDGQGTFTHRLGHGLGLSPQEAPSLEPRSQAKVVEGQVLAVEPGLYLTGQWGIRLEDDAVVTATGADRLTQAPCFIPEVT